MRLKIFQPTTGTKKPSGEGRGGIVLQKNERIYIIVREDAYLFKPKDMFLAFAAGIFAGMLFILVATDLGKVLASIF